MRLTICNAAIRFMRAEGMTSLNPTQVQVLQDEAKRAFTENHDKLFDLWHAEQEAQKARRNGGLPVFAPNPYMGMVGRLAAVIGRHVMTLA